MSTVSLAERRCGAASYTVTVNRVKTGFARSIQFFDPWTWWWMMINRQPQHHHRRVVFIAIYTVSQIIVIFESKRLFVDDNGCEMTYPVIDSLLIADFFRFFSIFFFFWRTTDNGLHVFNCVWFSWNFRIELLLCMREILPYITPRCYYAIVISYAFSTWPYIVHCAYAVWRTGHVLRVRKKIWKSTMDFRITCIQPINRFSLCSSVCVACVCVTIWKMITIRTAEQQLYASFHT